MQPHIIKPFTADVYNMVMQLCTLLHAYNHKVAGLKLRVMLKGFPFSLLPFVDCCRLTSHQPTASSSRFFFLWTQTSGFVRASPAASECVCVSPAASECVCRAGAASGGGGVLWGPADEGKPGTEGGCKWVSGL